MSTHFARGINQQRIRHASRISLAFAGLLLLSACDGGRFPGQSPDTNLVSGQQVSEQPEPQDNPGLVSQPLPDLEPDPDPDPGSNPASESEPTEVFSSIDYPILSNGSVQHADAGPQSVYKGRETNFPGLRYGDFLLKNNAWNLYNTRYEEWVQAIALEESDGSITAKVDWDYGVQADLNSIYAVTAYPELIYGVKSQYEVSGDFQSLGLPVQVSQSPAWTVDYGFRYVERLSARNTFSSTPDSEFNIAIESFWHESCDIQRDNDPRLENTVFELMVWLKVRNRRPSGQPPVARYTTTDGRAFDVYTKYGNDRYVAYVSTEEISTGTIRYSEIIQDAIDNADAYGIYKLQSTDCMANILLGPEIWHGAGTFYWDDFRVNRYYD